MAGSIEHTVVTDGNLRDGTAVTEDEDGDEHEHLQTIGNVDDVADGLAIDTEECLAKVAEWLAVGVHAHVLVVN